MTPRPTAAPAPPRPPPPPPPPPPPTRRRARASSSAPWSSNGSERHPDQPPRRETLEISRHVAAGVIHDGPADRRQPGMTIDRVDPHGEMLRVRQIGGASLLPLSLVEHLRIEEALHRLVHA